MTAKLTFTTSRRSATLARHLPFASRHVLLACLLALGVGISSLRAQSVVLVGSGSTVPAPLYSVWGQEFAKHNGKIQLRFVPVGTEEGIKQVSHGSGDFAAGELPLSEKQRSEEGLVELPAALVGIVPIYNIPHVHEQLRLSGDVLADIYLGGIKNWNAPQIAKLNPGVDLPDLPIKVIQRPAGKGSNYIFTEFLSKANAKFHSQIGVGLSPKWPVGEPAERSSDMAERVKAQAGAIGYVEYQYATKNYVQQALLQNSAGKFVKANSQTLTAACESVEAPSWHSLSASLINAHGADSYPMASFTWVYLPTRAQDASRTEAIGSFLSWIYSDGQSIAEDQGYTRLPSQLLAEVKKQIASVH